jgi:UDP-GlcNAc:undecaprenyl-phosphate GlcNAc-1-phosphate transferase
MLFVGVASLIVAMGVTWLVTPLVIRIAPWLGAVDQPGDRKIHHDPVPRIGGLAVFVGFVAGLLFAGWVTDSLRLGSQVSVYWQGLALAIGVMLIAGLVDDIRGLSFRFKFAIQIAAAVFVWFCGFRVETITHPLGGALDLGALSLPVTVLWIVTITNALNLIDGLDGLATGIALITTTAVATIALVRAELGVTAASVALAGGLMGFLPYNSNPARIFLGDSGSMFLGFTLAVTSVRGSQKGPTIVAILAPLLVLGLPLLDTSLAVFRRLGRVHRSRTGGSGALVHLVRNLDHVFLPDRGHIHHRLLEAGLSHRLAVLVLYGVGIVFALCGLAIVMVQSAPLGVLLLTVLSLLMAAFLAPLYLGNRPNGPQAGHEAGPATPGAVGPRAPLAAAPPSSERP